MRILAIVIAALNFLSVAQAETIDVKGVSRTYILDRPTTTKPAPLIVALHGGGGSAQGFRRDSGLTAAANAAGVVVVYPESVTKQWNDGRAPARQPKVAGTDDIGFLQAVVKALVAQGIADPAHVVFTGVSNGGMMSIAMACRSDTPIYGIVPVSANAPVGLDCTHERARFVNVVGTADRVVPMAGGDVLFGWGQGQVQSSQATFNQFMRAAGCNGARQSPMPDTANDGMTSVAFDGIGCRVSPIRQIVVNGGGHAWAGGATRLKAFLGQPTQDFSASDLAVQMALGK